MLNYKTYEKSLKDEWVVFLHGMGGSSSIWYKQIKDFKKQFNLLFIDLRGHGKSKANLTDIKTYTLEQVSREVIAVLDQLNIKSAHFIGVSLGSVIIHTIALIDKTRIRSMVLGGAIPRFNLRSKLLIEIGDLTKIFMPYMWLYRFFAWIIMPRAKHNHSRQMFVNEAQSLGQKEFVRWFKLSKQVESLYHQSKGIEVTIPKLYIMGRGDYMFLPIVEKETVNSKYTRLSIIEDCGHVSNVDQPKNFNEQAIKFIYSVEENETRSLYS